MDEGTMGAMYANIMMKLEAIQHSLDLLHKKIEGRTLFTRENPNDSPFSKSQSS